MVFEVLHYGFWHPTDDLGHFYYCKNLLKLFYVGAVVLLLIDGSGGEEGAIVWENVSGGVVCASDDIRRYIRRATTRRKEDTIGDALRTNVGSEVQREECK